LVAHIAVDSGAQLDDVLDPKHSDQSGAVPRSTGATAVLAEQALLSYFDSEIDQAQENQRWSLGAFGGAGVVILSGAGEIIRAFSRRKRGGLDRWWADDTPDCTSS
jgi:hypothetical protein